MVLCTVIMDPVSGSDTAASGSNAPTTAVTGTNGDATASGTTLTLNETVDLSGANDDGSDVLFVEGITGERHLFRISSYTGGAATCTAIVTVEAFDSTISGENWAVGGKRKTYYAHATNYDFQDGTAGWIFTLQDGATYVHPGAVCNMSEGDQTDGPVTIRCASGSDVLIENGQTNGVFAPNLAGSRLQILGDSTTNRLTIRCTGADSATKACVYVNVHNQSLFMEHVTLDGNDVGTTWTVTTVTVARFVDVEFMQARTGASGFAWTGNRSSYELLLCSFHDNDSHGALVSSTSALSSVLFMGCKSFANGGSGFRLNMAVGDRIRSIISCTSDGNVADGIALYGAPNATASVTILHNILSKNDNGVSWSDGGVLNATPGILHLDYNAYWDNTTAEVDTVTKGPNDITLTADPYNGRTDSPPDFTLNNNAGGGAACRDVGLEAA